MFRVYTHPVEEYAQGKFTLQRGEPYNHSNGTAYIENMIGTVKSLIDVAYQYVLRNPNIPYWGPEELSCLPLP